MATKTYYLTATTGDGWRTLDEATQTAATNADGWTHGTGNTNHSEFQVGTKRAATTFTGTTVPDGSLDTSLKDAFRSTNALIGDFASANWTFTFVVRAPTSATGQNGRIRFRLLKAAADGSSATELPAAQQQCSLTGGMASTSADFTTTLTVNPGAFSLANQYLFIQVAWERTTAASMTTADVQFRTGSSASAGTRITTSDFTPGAQTLSASAATVNVTAATATPVAVVTLAASAAPVNVSAPTATISAASPSLTVLVELLNGGSLVKSWTVDLATQQDLIGTLTTGEIAALDPGQATTVRVTRSAGTAAAEVLDIWLEGAE